MLARIESFTEKGTLVGKACMFRGTILVFHAFWCWNGHTGNKWVASKAYRASALRFVTCH